MSGPIRIDIGTNPTMSQHYPSAISLSSPSVCLSVCLSVCGSFCLSFFGRNSLRPKVNGFHRVRIQSRRSNFRDGHFGLPLILFLSFFFEIIIPSPFLLLDFLLLCFIITCMSALSVSSVSFIAILTRIVIVRRPRRRFHSDSASI